MPKTKKRKKNKPRASGGRTDVRERVEREAPAAVSGRVSMVPRVSLQNVVFPLMVALGLLGLAIFFTFFYTEDANHFLYSAIAGLTALGWLVISARRWSSYRQRAN